MTSSPPANRWLILVAVMMAFLPIVLDLTILHVAIPSLTLALRATGTETLWIIDVYPLLMASLLIPMGTLADRAGHRRMLLAGLSIFLLGSSCAAFSLSPGLLIAARAVMAVGAAMVMPCTLAIVRQTFVDEKERAIALGTWGAVGSAGAAIGPLVGGALLEHFWWGSVFLINVPVLFVVIPLVAALTPQSARSSVGKWPMGQAVVLMLGIMATVYALKAGFKPNSSLVITGLSCAMGISALVWFVRQQQRTVTPMLDMTLFSRPAISAGVVMALVVMGSLAGVELMLAQELQFVLGRTPLEAGMFMLPLMIGSAIGGPFAGVILGALGLRCLATLSLLISAASLFTLGQIDFISASTGVTVLLGALGLALGIGLTASSVAIMSNTPAEKAGSAGALEATSYDLGSGLGITGFGILLTSSYQRALQVPSDIMTSMPDDAAHSIGETLLAAQGLEHVQGAALAQAARDAFSASHNVVLTNAAILIALVSVVVFVVLRDRRTQV